jgi:hypothetical protein
MTTLALRAETLDAAPDHPAIADLIATGAHLFPEPLDRSAAAALLGAIRAGRAYDSSLFLSEAEFDADPQYRGVNPRPGRNLLERFERELAFVEQDPQIVGAVTALLGPGYTVMDRKVVCGVPAKSVPPWLRARIEGAPVNNLGAFVRPEYRDVTYFYGIDFHQDLIDYKARQADFLTLYVYLHPVTAADAPLFLLEGSQALGGTLFPHDLTRMAGTAAWRYGDRKGQQVEVRQRVLTGGAGFAAIWHSCTLHGTQPDAADRERISLRYLLARQEGGTTGIDAVNATLKGPLSLTDTRVDLAHDGSVAVRGNVVNRA